MEILKDVSIMCLDDNRIAEIARKFSTGDMTRQEAFDDLVTSNISDLEKYVDVKDNGALRVVRKACSRQRKLLEASALKKANIASTYIQPSVELAKASIEGDNSEAYAYVIENLTENMDPEAGDISSGALFSPSRLSACGKELKKKEDSKFTIEDGVLHLCDRRFGSYTIEEIKLAIRTGGTSKGALEMLLDFVGMDEEETPNGKEKKGTLGSFITKLREEFGGTEGNEFALDAAEALELTLFDLRDQLINEKRLADKVNERAKEMAKLQRRASKNAQLGIERDEVALTVDSHNEGETEA
jgi:hypothetical protein